MSSASNVGAEIQMSNLNYANRNKMTYIQPRSGQIKMHNLERTKISDREIDPDLKNSDLKKERMGLIQLQQPVGSNVFDFILLFFL